MYAFAMFAVSVYVRQGNENDENVQQKKHNGIKLNEKKFPLNCKLRW